MLQFEKTIEMNATYAFYLPPFRQKKTGISKQMEIPVKPESIYEFIIAQRLTESKVALCFNSLHYLSFCRNPAYSCDVVLPIRKLHRNLLSAICLFLKTVMLSFTRAHIIAIMTILAEPYL